MARVGFIGTGEIASHMVRGLAGQGHAITVSSRNAEVAAALARAHPEVRIADNAGVVGDSDVVILCLLAPVARAVLPGLPWRAGQAVISVMVDVPLADLATLCAPATDIALTIPLPFVAKGGCPLPVFPDRPALRDLFGVANPILPVASERALNAHFGATALCSPILAQLQEGAAWLAKATGDKDAAEAYVTAMFAGFLGDLAQQGPGALLGALDSLSTPGGLNAALRDHMAAAGAPEALRDGLDRLGPRLGIDAAEG